LCADLRKYAVLVPQISEYIADSTIFAAPTMHGNQIFSLSPCGMMIMTLIGVKIIIPQGRKTTPALEFAKIRVFLPQQFSSLFLFHMIKGHCKLPLLHGIYALAIAIVLFH
jgi:hypothetical protein